MASPLLGYNTNVRHLGKLYHIQTEDSGTGHGHIFTHLFADGGRIIASKKTTYAEHIGSAQYPDVVKRLMKESHKAMFIALRDGLFDADEAAGARAIAAMSISLSSEIPTTPSVEQALDVDEFERAAEAKLAESAARSTPSVPSPARPSPARPSPAQGTPASGSVPAAASSASSSSLGAAATASPGRYQSTRAASPSAARAPKKASARPSAQSESIFGGDLLSEKSLDEVILSYLAEDVEDE